MRVHRLNWMVSASVALLVLAFGTVAMADSFGSGFNIDFVPISGATNPTSGYGIVNHDYRMGTYEITNDQWNKFKTNLGVPVTGADGGYNNSSYYTCTSVPTDNVSWFEAAQFVNWLNTSTNHQAAYKFNGTQGTPDYTFATWSASDAADGTNLYRNKNAFYYLPTENEWVKAAYWNDTALQTYATVGDVLPAQGNGTSWSGWNYWDNGHATNPAGPWNIGSGSEELKGTYDMMGNVFEWMESPWTSGDYNASSSRGLRAGDWCSARDFCDLAASSHDYYDPSVEGSYLGFRVGSVPEPDSTTLLVCSAIAALILWRRRK